ncbi:MAG: hypothetical protein DGJ47_000101 [Rickettsiaceae bacterium]
MIKKKIERLRKELVARGYYGYIVPCNDEYMSEYTPTYAQRLKYITGFTGSNGLAIILPKTTLFFTDGRYIKQAQTQLDSKEFEVHNQNELLNFNWRPYVNSDSKIAFDPKLFTHTKYQLFEKLNLTSELDNLIDIIWDSKPQESSSTIYNYPVKYSGQSREHKIKQCREFIKNNGASALFISDPASVCWLLNIRASDVEFTPILLANSLITKDNVYVFADQKRIESGFILDQIKFISKDSLQKMFDNIKGKIIYDKTETSLYTSLLIKAKDHICMNSPCLMWKAKKNSVEIEFAKRGHIEDAVAVCETLAFLEKNDISNMTEYDVGEMLQKNRSKRPGYVSESFPAICGFQENGAIIHYKAEKSTAKNLSGNGLLLIDSGGQYWGSTTDITRTIPIGKATPEHIKSYTLVLKGHIALACAKFPENKVFGSHLDVLARQYLWKNHQDYAHGTGHGVGSFLSVHEGPQSISLGSGRGVLSSGMILSNEPGYYVENNFGIRIENLVYIKQEDYGYLSFDNLTLVPYEKRLIDFSMLNNDEIMYLKNYNKKIRLSLLELLSQEAKDWLQKQTDYT